VKRDISGALAVPTMWSGVVAEITVRAIPFR
jgi:hypothetical protein